MENLIMFLATSFVLRLTSPRKYGYYTIGNTGCSALLLSNNDIDMTRTASGDQLYCTEFIDNKVTYGMICIILQQEYNMDEAVALLKNYINKLKGPFYILHNTGLKNSIDWNSTASRAVVDYWQDANQRDWKLKGYTDGKVMTVLYVKNISDVTVEKQDLFLDSFHFKGSY
jgi:hypothetical protein